MALSVELKHVIKLKNGPYLFRRRLPAKVFRATGHEFFETTMRSKDPSSENFMKEHALLLREWKALADSYKASMKAAELSPQQAYKEALKRRVELLNGVVGLSEADAVSVILEHNGGQFDSLTRRVLADPAGAKPAYTMADARVKYVKDKGIGSNIKKMQRIDRAFNQLEEAIGAPKEIALVDLKKKHGEKWLDTLKIYRQANGQPYAVDTMKRMTNDLKAVVNHAITFVDFDKPVSNPFTKLPFPDEEQIKAVDRKASMPDHMMHAITARIEKRARVPDLLTIWKMLTVTGCRLSEIGFLQMKDIDLDGSQSGGIPVVHVRPNEFRRVKDLATMRTLPLVGRGLEAAREHVAKRAAEGAEPGDALFPAYAKVKNDQNATDTAASNLSKR
jgi:integrase